MRILYICGALLVLCVLNVVGHSLHGHDHGHEQFKKISFSVKHDDHMSHGNADHGHKHHHGEQHGVGHHGQHHSEHHGHKVEHHENHVVHKEHHGHDKQGHDHGHQAHHEHHVEHHGNNGHDDHHGHGHHDHHGHGHHDHHGHEHHAHHDHGHAKYEFKYGVKDPKTGDFKQQWEARDGDKVKGVYSLKESDGTKRIVEYSADKKKGFEATVHKIGHAHHNQDHSKHGHHETVKHDHQVHIKHDHHEDHKHGKHGHHHHEHNHGDNHGHPTSFVIVKKESKH